MSTLSYADRVRQVRELHGLGLMDARRAVEIADSRFGGDIALGGWFIHASALAVNVKGGPEARDRWNEAYARLRVEASK